MQTRVFTQAQCQQRVNIAVSKSSIAVQARNDAAATRQQEAFALRNKRKLDVLSIANQMEKSRTHEEIRAKRLQVFADKRTRKRARYRS